MTYDEDSYSVRHERRSERARKRKAVWIGVCVGFVIAGVVAYMTFGRYVSVYGGSDGDLPLIKAETRAFGVPPETPGGMDVPNQDKLIYERLRESDDVPVEKLLPAPEKPHFPQEEEISENEIDSQIQEIPENEKEEKPESLEVASTTMIDENGERVEVMFRTIPETQAQGQVEQVREENKEKKQAVQEKAPVKTASKTVSKERFAIQLVSTKSKESSESEWKRLSKKHAEILKNLPHNISEIKTSSAVFYRLRAGDFETREKAIPVCEKLKAKKQECLVVKQ